MGRHSHSDFRPVGLPSAGLRGQNFALRTVSLALLALASCEAAPPPPAAVQPSEQPLSPQPKVAAAADDRIDCAPPGTKAFARLCVLEIRGDLLIVRQPDGGFHRLRRVADDRGVIAADGSEAPNVADLDDGTIEVSIGGARYRLPAR